MVILSFDPSGSYKYGSGMTGWSLAKEENETLLVIDVGVIKAKNFLTKEDYFKEHKNLIIKTKPELIILENFILYSSTMKSLTNQEMETSELIGYIMAAAEEIKVVRQLAQLIKGVLSTKPAVLVDIINSKDLTYKTSKNNNVLWYYKGKRVTNHTMDSLRHIAYYKVNKNGRAKK